MSNASPNFSWFRKVTIDFLLLLLDSYIMFCQPSVSPINTNVFQNFHHLHPICPIKRFFKINKTNAHIVSIFKTSFTQHFHGSNRLSSTYALSESKLCFSDDIYCFSFNPFHDYFKHDFGCMWNQAYCPTVFTFHCIYFLRQGYNHCLGEI